MADIISVYGKLLLEAMGQTLIMAFYSLIFASIIGLIFGMQRHRTDICRYYPWRSDDSSCILRFLRYTLRFEKLFTQYLYIHRIAGRYNLSFAQLRCIYVGDHPCRNSVR